MFQLFPNQVKVQLFHLVRGKGKYLTNHILHPTSGSLCERLVKNAGHWPLSVPKMNNDGKVPSQLCQWAGGKNIQSTVDVAIC